jgi:hypothetical protein
MMMPVKEIREWLDFLPDDAQVGIDEGGLSLVLAGSPTIYIEVGGLPSSDDEPQE